jgi:predicted RNase H-like HicB family nuclease
LLGEASPRPARIVRLETAITLCREAWRKVYFHNRLIDLHMFSEYIEAALERAVYKIIDDEEPIFVSVPELPGAWATAKTVEEARKELISVIEGWIALRLRMGRSIPSIGGHTITASIEPVSVIE